MSKGEAGKLRQYRHLPGLDKAIADERKVQDYLLAAEHPAGSFKAVFFGRSGFRKEHWQQLKDGRAPLVRVIWFIESGEDRPRLVTAYPLEGESE